MWQTIPEAATGDWKSSVADSYVMSRVRRISSSDDDDERSRKFVVLLLLLLFFYFTLGIIIITIQLNSIDRTTVISL